MKTKSCLSYFGSDSEVAGELASLLNHCSHVTIPFVGGGSLIPHLTAKGIVCADKLNKVINFYRVLKGDYGDVSRAALIARCERTLSHPAALKTASLQIDSGCPVDRAWAYWCQCWVPRKGNGGTLRQADTSSVRRTAEGGNNASRLKAVAADLHSWADEFQRCEFEEKVYTDLLPKVSDRVGCGIYCDPPWVGAGDRYECPFTLQDHKDLAQLLRRFKHATVLIRYGDDPLIRALYSMWKVIESETRTQANSRKPELWITNRNPDGSMINLGPDFLM